jgi:hypothetical protein
MVIRLAWSSTLFVLSIRSVLDFSAGLAFLLMHGCSSGHNRDLGREAFIFAHVGNAPFTDSIETVGLEGGRAQVLLAPERRRSYLFAAGRSLSDRLAVLVHQADQVGTISDYLSFYYPKTKQWDPMTDQEGGVGSGVVSPDNLSIAFIRDAKARAGLAGLWLFDIQNKKSTHLVSDSPPTHWHANPAWRPNSKQIGLLELTRSDRGLSVQVVLSDLESNREEVLLAPVGAFCFSPDGTQVGLLTNVGLEVLSIASRERKIIAPWSVFQGRTYNGGGMSWSLHRSLLAIALFDQKSAASEIWTFPLDQLGSKRVYSSRGWIRGLSFIER